MRGELPNPVTGVAFPSPVPPGTGWPEDPASAETPVAHDAREVARLAADPPDLPELDARTSVCRACPRLVAWREEVAVAGRRAYAGEPYWGRPVPGWGPADARVLVVGLAPAVHGGNRTGRIFTGDRSGDWIFRALHRAGLATRERSRYAGDGEELVDTRIVAAVRCAPPQNAPTPAERDTCAPWLDAELRLGAADVRVLLALGGFAWAAALSALGRAGRALPRPRPRFAHGAEVALPGGPVLIGSYHVSQQNTFTGKLTEQMLDAVVTRAATLARHHRDPPSITAP